jgi:hypothetical protein
MGSDFPYGNVVPAASDIFPPESWPEFGFVGNPPALCAPERVGEAPRGIRWSLWPLTFEEYISDREPDLAASRKGRLARNRVIMWKRVHVSAAPKEWRETARPHWRVDGVHRLFEDYRTRWEHNARHDAKVWREKYLGAEYRIDELSTEEFSDAYRQSSVSKKTGGLLLEALLRKLELPERKGAVRLLGVKENKTGRIIAGTAILSSLTLSSSVRECPFMLPESRGIPASTGLIDHWFQESLENGIKNLFFTGFWQKGDPRSWKSFSEFKSHFGLRYYAYPPLLWRFERGKMF